MARVRKAFKWALEAGCSFLGVKIEGKRFNVPLGAPRSPIEERWMPEVLRRILPVFDGAFLDVGANMGQTLLSLRAVDEARRYIGFEPNPRCAAYLEGLIDANRFQNTEIIPAACSTHFGIEVLHYYQDNRFDASASMISDFRPTDRLRGQSHIVAVPLGACLEAMGLDNLGVVKIDVEGFEATVMRALADRMTTDRPGIIIEILPVYSTENIDRMQNRELIQDFITEFEYKMFQIIKTESGEFGQFRPLQAVGIHGDMQLVDYLFCPTERTSAILANRA